MFSTIQNITDRLIGVISHLALITMYLRFSLLFQLIYQGFPNVHFHQNPGFVLNFVTMRTVGLLHALQKVHQHLVVLILDHKKPHLQLETLLPRGFKKQH